MISNVQANVIFKDTIVVEDIISSIDDNNHYTFRTRLGINEEDYQLRLRAFVKFISVQSILGESNFIPVSSEVDDLWHEFILQTGFYRKFCNSLKGMCFIDHQSIGFDDYSEVNKLGGEDSLVHVMLWLGFHYGYFGRFTEADRGLWTAVEFLSNEMDYTLENINCAAKDIYDEIIIKVDLSNG